MPAQNVIAKISKANQYLVMGWASFFRWTNFRALSDVAPSRLTPVGAAFYLDNRKRRAKDDRRARIFCYCNSAVLSSEERCPRVTPGSAGKLPVTAGLPRREI